MAPGARRGILSLWNFKCQAESKTPPRARSTPAGAISRIFACLLEGVIADNARSLARRPPVDGGPGRSPAMLDGESRQAGREQR